MSPCHPTYSSTFSEPLSTRENAGKYSRETFVAKWTVNSIQETMNIRQRTEARNLTGQPVLVRCDACPRAGRCECQAAATGPHPAFAGPERCVDRYRCDSPQSSTTCVSNTRRYCAQRS